MIYLGNARLSALSGKFFGDAGFGMPAQRHSSIMAKKPICLKRYLTCEGDMSGPEKSAGGQPPTAAAVVAEALAQMVLTQMAPGSSLPSEGDLAVRFDVSRLTVREAVKLLAGRGLLDVGRGRR